MKAQLFILSGRDVGRSFDIGESAVLGRVAECEVTLHDRSIRFLEQSQADITDVSLQRIWPALFKNTELLGHSFKRFHLGLSVQCFDFDGALGFYNFLISQSLSQ